MNRIYILVFFITCFIISCRNSDTPVDSFFKTVEKSVDSNKLTMFKNAPKDSALFYFKNFEYEFSKIYYDSVQLVVLNDFFYRFHIGNRIETRFFCLCFAFHSKLNDREFNSHEIIQDSYKEHLKIKYQWDKKEKLLKLEHESIIQTNNKRWNIGDTIDIILPVKFENSIKFTSYCNNYPASLDYSTFYDSLKIKGKILQKKYYTYPIFERLDTTEVMFKLKILRLSNSNYLIFEKKSKIKDSFDLHLSAYGRLIK